MEEQPQENHQNCEAERTHHYANPEAESGMWSDIERLEGTRFQARVVQTSDGKKWTVAAYDPHWSKQRTVRAINDHLSKYSAPTAVWVPG